MNDQTTGNRTTTSSTHDIDSGGKRLFARRWQPAGADPEAPAIVLFHDSLGCVELWREFPADLAAATGLPVVAYDRLGFGRSDANPGRLGRDFIADEARTGFAAVRGQLGIGRFVALGHSVGCGMAIAAADTFPDACAAVVTQAAQAFVEDRTLAGIREAQVQFASPDQFARLARYHGDKTQWVLDAWIKTWLAPAFADWTLDDVLERVRCPVLAMHGDRDEFGSRVHLDRIAARAGGPVTAILFEECGHVPHREHPGKVVDTVTRFLADAHRA